MNQLAKRTREALAEWKNEEWQSLLTSLSPDNCSLWRIAKALRNKKQRIPPIHGENGIVYSELDKANSFAASLEKQFTPNYTRCDLDHIDRVNRHVRRMLNSPPAKEGEDAIFTDPEEVSSILKHLKLKKAPGPDSVTNSTLRQLGRKPTIALTNILNCALRAHHFPSHWKQADVIVIPKGTENRSFPQNYRPISLLSSIGKIYERILHRRLSKITDILKILPDEQHGFRAGHSTSHQLLRVVEHITHAFNWKQSTGALFLDVRKAFDKVWHNGLIFKMTQAGIPKSLCLTMASFLRARTFRVKIGDAISQDHVITAGVPQGSVLSPLLYNIFTHDVPKTPNTFLCQYADDTAVLARSTQPRHICRRLQEAADNLTAWFDRWRIEVNGTKSTAVLFTRRRKNPTANITVADDEVPWATKAKYLGVQLDKRLTWVDHVKYIRNKAAGGNRSLNPLMCDKSTLSRGNKVRLFTAVVRPMITYAAPIWAYGMSKAAFTRLETIQSKWLRRALCAPRYISNRRIRKDLNIPSLQAFIRTSAERFLLLASTHQNESIAQAVRYDVSHFRRYRRPRHILSDPPAL